MKAWWLALLFWATGLSAAERSYWAWGSRGALTTAETAELQRQGVRRLYWHVATLGGEREPLVIEPGGRDFAKLAPAFEVVAVIRVESRVLPEGALFARLREKLFGLNPAGWQIDFDCPDRQLGEYAALLGKLRATWPHLGITALAHWPAVQEFPALARSVEELCPMFYDLQRDPTGVSAASPPPPLLDPAQVQPLLDAWSKCPTPWRAGLPVFSRVTIFDATGLSRGQIFDWDWDEVAFHAKLRTLGPTKLGVTLLRAGERLKFAGRALEEGEIVAARQTDRGALDECLSAAEKAGARGTVLFRLPGGGDAATWSLRSLGAAPVTPQLVLRREGERLVLENPGPADLPPRLAGERHDRDRGYALEIDAPAAVFREAEPGAFFRVNAHTDPEAKKPLPSAVQTATRLTFWFSQLPAGATLRSGLFQLAPAAKPDQLRWRITGGEWKPLTQSP